MLSSNREENDTISDVSDPSGPFYAVWASENQDHQVVTATKNQAEMLLTMFRSMNLKLAHITEHNSRMAAELFLATQTSDGAKEYISPKN